MAVIFERSISLAIAAALAATVWAAAPVHAQMFDTQRGYGAYDVQTLNFDLWCLETQRYAAARCDARTPEDVEAFEAHRAIVERYELQYLMEREREAEANERANRSYNPPWIMYEDNFGH